MTATHIYYFSPFEYSFRSGSMLQESRNFKALAEQGNKVFFYGNAASKSDFAEVQAYIGDADVSLIRFPISRRYTPLLHIPFLARIARDSSRNKVVIGRHLRMTGLALRWRQWLGNPVIVHELHERAFPHLLAQEAETRAQLKQEMRRTLDRIDGLFLTNYSQEIILKQEFDRLPPYTIVPHAVEWDKFHAATPGKRDETPDAPIIITYTGHFVAWKSVELLFETLALLDKRFQLRIAGGISGKTTDDVSRDYIQQLTAKYNLSGRVDFRGFVSPNRIVPDVLTGSSILALPLGDNLESRYFTCPIKLLEYIATQIPVVAVDYPSVRMLTGEDSVFLAQDNAAQFAEACKRAVFSGEAERRVRRMNVLAQRRTFPRRAEQVSAWYSGLLEHES